MQLFKVMARIMLDDGEFRSGITNARNEMTTFSRVVGKCNEVLNGTGSNWGTSIGAIGKEADEASNFAQRFHSNATTAADILKPYNELAKTFEVIGKAFGWLGQAERGAAEVKKGAEAISETVGFAAAGAPQVGNFTSILNGLKLAFRSLGDYARKAKAWFGELGMKAKEAGAKLASYFYNKLKIVGVKVQAFGLKIKALGVKMYALLGPKGLIIAGVTALIAIFVNWLRNNEEAQEKLKAVWEKIQGFIGVALEFIQEIVGRVFAWVQGFIDDHGETIMKIFSKVWETVKTVVETVVGVVQGIVETVFGAIQTFIDNHGETIMTIFSTVWDTIKSVFDTVVNGIQAALGLFIAIFQGDWDEAWERVKEIGRNFMDAIGNILGGIVDIGKNVITGLWEGIKSMGTWIKDRVTEFFDNSVLNALKTVTKTSLNKKSVNHSIRWGDTNGKI